jgi:hypothetical protein
LPRKTTAQQATNQLRFGSNLNHTASRTINTLYDRLRPLFKNITEKFFWGFISLDLCGMWPGRFITGLLAGRKEYDIRQDEETRNLPFPQQFKRWASKTWQGLNWPNCWEEVKREVIVAPIGILAIPTLAFFVGRHSLSNMIEMPYNTLKRLGEGFIEHMQEAFPSPKASLSKEGYREAVADHMANLFVDPLLEKTVVADPVLRQQLKNYPSVQQALRQAGREEPNYTDFLRNRFQTWTDHLLDPPLSNADLEKQLTTISQEIQEQLLSVNRKYRMEPYKFMRKGMREPVSIAKPTLFSDHAWVALSREHTAENIRLESFLENLRRWGEFPRKLWQHQAASKEAPALVETARGILKQSIAQKGLVVFSLVALSTAWLIRMTRFAQSSKSYQATRNLQPSTDNSPASPAPGMQQYRPVPAGIPSFAQTLPAWTTTPGINPLGAPRSIPFAANNNGGQA